MRRLILRSLETVAYGAIVLVVLGFGAAGAAAMGGFFGFLVGCLGGAILSIVLFGVLFLLLDIADNTRRTAELLQSKTENGSASS